MHICQTWLRNRVDDRNIDNDLLSCSLDRKSAGRVHDYLETPFPDVVIFSDSLSFVNWVLCDQLAENFHHMWIEMLAHSFLDVS